MAKADRESGPGSKSSGDIAAPNLIAPEPMPIIVGSPRSGTTLLRLMLDAHPDVAIPPETGFLAIASQFTGSGTELRDSFFRAITTYPPDAPAWQDFEIPAQRFFERLVEIDPFTVSEGFRAFYRLYAGRFGKARWGDKTPVHSMSIEAINACLPESRFIHLIRDGRDVALSLRPLWFSPGWEIESQAKQWLSFVRSAREQGRRYPNYIEVRYEELVLNPKREIDRICRFVNLSYNDTMMTYYRRAPQRLAEHKTRYRADGTLIVTKEERFSQNPKTIEPPDPSRVFAWKRTMSIEDRDRFNAVAGEMLEDLGYEL